MRRAALILLAACGGGGGFPDAKPIDDAPSPTGSFSLAWTVDDQSNAQIPCDRVGATSLTVTYHNRAFQGGQTEVFDCATGMGTGDGLIAGQYDFAFELDAISGKLADAPSQLMIDIPAGTTTPLQPITFAVDATGALALTMSAGKPGGNCAAITAMGAGITATQITLTHQASGACEPVMFMISAGATLPASSYTVDCAAPVNGPCIDSDQTLTAMPVPSDGYQIHVNGLVGASPCWFNLDTFQVPALGQTLTRSLNLAYATGMPGC